MKHKNITVSGRVQGVGFRYSAKMIAHSYQIYGFVKNLPDGSVYIEAEGEDDRMELFLAWCKKGPDRAKVSYAFITEGNVLGYTDFETRF